MALPLAINEAVLKPLFPEAHTLLNDWYTFDHYLFLTAFGYLLASTAGSWQWFAERRHRFALGGVSVYVVAAVLFELAVIHRNTPADAFAGNVFTYEPPVAIEDVVTPDDEPAADDADDQLP